MTGANDNEAERQLLAARGDLERLRARNERLRVALNEIARSSILTDVRHLREIAARALQDNGRE
jgi:hypothetical protein